jgi:hypothetical protein
MLKKLTVIKDVKLVIEGMPSIWMTGEEILLELILTNDLTLAFMANPYFIHICEELGATHWEVTDVPVQSTLPKFPANFYGPVTYHGGD